MEKLKKNSVLESSAENLIQNILHASSSSNCYQILVSVREKVSKNPKFSIDRYGEKPTNSVNYYKTCMSENCSKKFNKDCTDEVLIRKYGTTNLMEIPGSLEKLKVGKRGIFLRFSLLISTSF